MWYVLAFLPVLVGLILDKRYGDPSDLFSLWYWVPVALICGGYLAAGLAAHNQPLTGEGAGGLIVALLYLLWRWRRKFRRAAKWLGYKAQAAREKLLRKAREVLQPSPLPQPQGAGG